MSLRRLQGELLIDHSASPGVPSEWADQGVVVAEAGQRVEMATYTCRHCTAVVVMNAQRTRERNVCRKCMAVVCDRPSCVLECQPFERLIDHVMAGRPLNVDPTTGLLIPRRI